MNMTRREAIRLAGAGLGFAAIVKGQNRVPTWKTEMRQLAPNVYAYIQGGGPGQMNQGVSNGGIVVGENNVLLIDSLGAPIHAKNFIAAIRQVAPNKPMSRIVISHHHGDHIMGLPFFPQPVEIVCHEYCRQEMLATKFPSPTWEKRENWSEGGEPRVIVPPTTTIDDRTTYYYGNTEVQLITMAPSHTYGDIAVYLPQHKILFAADIDDVGEQEGRFPQAQAETCEQFLIDVARDGLHLFGQLAHQFHPTQQQFRRPILRPF